MNGPLRRIAAMFMRYLYLHKRSVPRTLELIFWPVMELFVWGFVTIYIQSAVQTSFARFVVFLINAMIFWDVLYRSQQGVTISFLEEIWTSNMLNLLVSPLRVWEWIATTFVYGMLKTFIITVILAVLAYFLYHFNLMEGMGFYLLPLVANLLIFGWTLGIFTSGLLLRWGLAAEALVWGVPFLVQPLSAIFYPLSVLPRWVQFISLALPSTHVFEGMRFVLQHGALPVTSLIAATLLNLAHFFLASLFFHRMFKSGLETGRLVRFGMY